MLAVVIPTMEVVRLALGVACLAVGVVRLAQVFLLRPTPMKQ